MLAQARAVGTPFTWQNVAGPCCGVPDSSLDPCCIVLELSRTNNAKQEHQNSTSPTTRVLALQIAQMMQPVHATNIPEFGTNRTANRKSSVVKNQIRRCTFPDVRGDLYISVLTNLPRKIRRYNT
jgi:hypothetical protein